MYKKMFLLSVILFFVLFPTRVFAQTPPPTQLYTAKIIQIISEGEQYIDDQHKNPYQTVVIKFLDGDKKGQVMTIDHGKATTIRDSQKVAVGEKVVVLKVPTPKGDQYQIVDKYRLDSLWPLIIFFFVLVLILSRLKGLGSIIG
ncbi:MAG TPA: hypothetical protein VF810_04250, partial [Patescibacteria group bacterium]